MQAFFRKKSWRIQTVFHNVFSEYSVNILVALRYWRTCVNSSTTGLIIFLRCDIRSHTFQNYPGGSDFCWLFANKSILSQNWFILNQVSLSQECRTSNIVCWLHQVPRSHLWMSNETGHRPQPHRTSTNTRPWRLRPPHIPRVTTIWPYLRSNALSSPRFVAW